VACNLVLEHIEHLSFICSEASRILVESGRFFVCELHPFRQYAGARATFQHRQQTVAIEAFVHHISDYLVAARAAGLALATFNEWWHEADHGSPPRLVSFTFEKAGG
jgi:malonyl-CoA O-methyltransferase